MASTTQTVDWAGLRAEFPILAKKVYLNSCSLGALSRRALDAHREFLELWGTYGAAAWYEQWVGKLGSVRERFARLIGAEPPEVAVLPNVSSALSVIASCFDLGQRPKVVTTELDFPTVPYQWLAKRRLGAELVLLDSPDRVRVPLERFEAAVDERTALVVTSRVFFTSGAIQDVKALAEIAHRRGAYLFVDDYQATGQIPLDVKAADVDLLVTGGLKWLLGGTGIAYLYVKDELIPRLTPTIAGWWGAANQFAFDPHDLVFWDHARRFEMGTPSVAAAYAGCAGLELVGELGPERIRRRTQALVEDLIEKARALGFEPRVAPRPEERSAIVMLPVPDPASVVERLAAQEIIVDFRPGAVRLSPYFYNAPEENDRALEAIRARTR